MTRFKFLSALLFILFLSTLSLTFAENHDRDKVVLHASEAQLSGSAMKKWGKWVVWCGHNICDGSYTWKFRDTGKYHFSWNVGHKCAGSAKYRLKINKNEIISGTIPQHGSCQHCTPENIVNNPGKKYGQMKNIDLGSAKLKAGDTIKLWVENDFACGIEKPGAYGFFDHMTLTKQ